MRVRILHVITRLELGGAQRNTIYTVAHLDSDRFDAALAWGPGGVLDPEAKNSTTWLNDYRLLATPSVAATTISGPPLMEMGSEESPSFFR